MKSPLFVSECGSCVYISCLVDGEAAKDDRIGESGEFPGFLVKHFRVLQVLPDCSRCSQCLSCREQDPDVMCSEFNRDLTWSVPVKTALLNCQPEDLGICVLGGDDQTFHGADIRCCLLVKVFSSMKRVKVFGSRQKYVCKYYFVLITYTLSEAGCFRLILYKTNVRTYEISLGQMSLYVHAPHTVFFPQNLQYTKLHNEV